MSAPRACLTLMISALAIAVSVAAQGVPLENLLRDGLKKPSAESKSPPSPRPVTPADSVSSGQNLPANSPSSPVARGGRLPFDVRLPQGWQARLSEENGMLAQSPNGASTVAVLPVLSFGNRSANEWLRHSAAAFLARYLPGAAVAAVYPSRLGAGGALASLEFQKGAVPGKASALLFTHGGMGTIFLIAAPAQDFDRQRQAMLGILRSFSFRGERASPSPAAPRTATSLAPGSRPSFTWRRFQDPNENAFTVEVPANWKIEGGVIRKSTVDVQSYLCATSPEGVVVILGDPDLHSYVIPTSTLSLSGLHEGSRYTPFSGNVLIVARYLPGPAYAQFHANRLAQTYQLTSLRLGQPRARNDLDQNIPTIGSSIRGGEVDFTAARNQKPVEGYVMAATSVMTMQGVEGGIWTVQLLVSYLAPQGTTPTARAALAHMLSSLRLNPEWVRQQRQLSESTYRAVRETNDYISKLFRDTFEEGQRVRDRQHREFGDVIRGVVRLRDPESGEVLEGRAGNNYYWRIRNTDTLVGSDLPDPPPSVDVTELEQVR